MGAFRDSISYSLKNEFEYFMIKRACREYFELSMQAYFLNIYLTQNWHYNNYFYVIFSAYILLRFLIYLRDLAWVVNKNTCVKYTSNFLKVHLEVRCYIF